MKRDKQSNSSIVLDLIANIKDTQDIQYFKFFFWFILISNTRTIISTLMGTDCIRCTVLPEIQWNAPLSPASDSSTSRLKQHQLLQLWGQRPHTVFPLGLQSPFSAVSSKRLLLVTMRLSILSFQATIFLSLTLLKIKSLILHVFMQNPAVFRLDFNRSWL